MTELAYRTLIAFVLLLHLGFVVFVVLGGVLVLFWHPIVWLHIPAVAWGLLVQFTDSSCPFTSLENKLRPLGGMACYTGSCIEHYLSLIMGGANRKLMNLAVLLILTANVLMYSYTYFH